MRKIIFSFLIVFALLNLYLNTSKVVAYDRVSAESYASYWFDKRNDQVYCSYIADCANFVSQCLIAGGLKFALEKGPKYHNECKCIVPLPPSLCPAFIPDPTKEKTIPAVDALHNNLLTYQFSDYTSKNYQKDITQLPEDFTIGDVIMYGDATKEVK